VEYIMSMEGREHSKEVGEEQWLPRAWQAERALSGVEGSAICEHGPTGKQCKRMLEEQCMQAWQTEG
jgi:hypothetical protein